MNTGFDDKRSPFPSKPKCVTPKRVSFVFPRMPAPAPSLSPVHTAFNLRGQGSVTGWGSDHRQGSQRAVAGISVQDDAEPFRNHGGASSS